MRSPAMCRPIAIAVMPYNARHPPGSRTIFATSHASAAAHSGSRMSECVTPRWLRMYATGPLKPTTKSRSGEAHAKKPAAMRRMIALGGASLLTVARASSAPDKAWVRVSIRGSGCALLALCVLHVHLRVGAMCRRFGIADVHRQAHVRKDGAERRE